MKDNILSVYIHSNSTKICHAHLLFIGIMCSNIHLDELWEEFETHHFTKRTNRPTDS